MLFVRSSNKEELKEYAWLYSVLTDAAQRVLAGTKRARLLNELLDQDPHTLTSKSLKSIKEHGKTFMCVVTPNHLSDIKAKIEDSYIASYGSDIDTSQATLLLNLFYLTQNYTYLLAGNKLDVNVVPGSVIRMESLNERLESNAHQVAASLCVLGTNNVFITLLSTNPDLDVKDLRHLASSISEN